MPEQKQKRVRFYMNEPVKRMRQGTNGIILTMLSATAGVPGRQITITQDDWDSHGEWRVIPATTNEDVRLLAVR